MTSRIGRIAAALSCLLAVSLALAACGGGGAKDAKLLRVGTLNEVDSLNPFVAITNEAAEVRTITSPTLVAFDNSGQITPSFASSWTISADGKSATFTLVSGARWSDGKPITADDVLWTFQTLLRYGKDAAANIASGVPVTGVSSTSPKSVTLKFSGPAGNGLGQLTVVPILPKHIWQKYATGDGKQLTSHPVTTPIVSGGPYYVRSFKKGQSLTLDRNPGWYGDKPHVQRIGFAFYSNSDALASAVTNGEVDAAERVQPSGAGKLRSAGLEVQTPTSLNELLLSISSSAHSKHPELLNPLVRQAIDLAIDRERVVKTAYYGFASPGSSLVPPALTEDHLQAPVTPFDLDKANALLDQAGFKRGSDGIRVADGHPMSYDFIELNDPSGPEAATLTILTEDFKQIGIQLHGRVLDAAAAFAAIFGPNNSYSNFDFALVTGSGSMNPAELLGYFTCPFLGVANFAGYCNKQYDAVYQKQTAEGNPTARRDLTHQLQQIMLKDKPVIVLAYARDVYAHSSKWTGLVTGPGGWFYPSSAAAVSAALK